MTVALPPDGLSQALTDVQRRYRRQRRLAGVRLALLVMGGVLIVLGVGRIMNPGSLSWPLALLTAGGAGLLTGLAAWRSSALSLLDAARLSDRRADLAGLLSTALTLPTAAGQGWEAALRGRVLDQAHEAAGSLRPAQVVPPPPRRVWSGPVAVLGVALVCWFVPPLPARIVTPEVAPAAAVEEATPVADSAAQSSTAASDVSGAPIVNEPEPEPVAQSPAGSGLSASSAPTSDASASTRPSERGAASQSTASPTSGAAPRLREARQTVGAGTEAATTSTPGRSNRATQDTPFGSRESGQFQNQSVTSPDRLASAPYDPAVEPGSQPMQQKSDPGSTGLRSASGGRGLESEGADKCVEGCLTNDDMNRGAQPARSGEKAPGGQTTSGTSDSGSGAAGGTSGVGLGVGTLRPIESAVLAELGGGAGVDADRIQVLAAPPPIAVPASTSSSRTTAGSGWISSDEAPGPSTSIPEAARSTVRAYFERTTP